METNNEKVQILIEMPLDKYTEVVLRLFPLVEEEKLTKHSGISLLTDQIVDQLKGRNIPVLGRMYAIMLQPQKNWRGKIIKPLVIMGITYALNDVIAPSNMLGGMKD